MKIVLPEPRIRLVIKPALFYGHAMEDVLSRRLLRLLAASFAVLVGGLTAAHADPSKLLISSPDVIDGRTFEDDSGQLYRLFAVRTPSLDATCENADGVAYPCGQEARRTLELYASGMLSCQKGGVDGDGVSLVRCFDFANRDLASRLVRAGWALPDRKVSQVYVFEELEAEARRQGMWGGRFTIR